MIAARVDPQGLVFTGAFKASFLVEINRPFVGGEHVHVEVGESLLQEVHDRGSNAAPLITGQYQQVWTIDDEMSDWRAWHDRRASLPPWA